MSTWDTSLAGRIWEQAILLRSGVHVSSIRPLSPCGRILAVLRSSPDASQKISRLASAMNPEFAGQIDEIVQVLADDELIRLAEASDGDELAELTPFGHAVAKLIESRSLDESSRPIAPSRMGRRASYQVLAGAD